MNESCNQDDVFLTSKRENVQIFLEDGRVFEARRGTTLEKFLQKLPEWENPQIVGAVVNGELRELTYRVEIDSNIKPITVIDPDGALIYRRSVTFLLEAAFEDLFPNAALTVDHSVVSGGYYCQLMDRPPLSPEELFALEKRMRELVQEDHPFERKEVPLAEAILYFKSRNFYDKVRLLKYRQKSHLVLYSLCEHRDYHHGYMVPSTGYIKWFGLAAFGDGFILRFPRRQSPTELLPLPYTNKLLDTFYQYGYWLAKLGIRDVGALNTAIEADRIREVILVSEALHEQNIIDIASKIAQNSKRSRIVLIAGPSSSGKTTFSKRLTVQLLALGISPFPLEMDNYFVDREKTPKDEKGEYDYEHLDALNRQLLGNHLSRLIAGEEVQLPRFDFKTGKSILDGGEVVKLDSDQLIILEGIQGLNPNLLPGIPPESTYRIYASCLTQLNLDRYNRISTTDSRLIRRIVRDSRERGYTAQQTIQRWESVRRGEKRYIFPYQDNADEMFNSALVYELSALKRFVEPLLRQVPYHSAEYIEAKRLLALFEWFLPLDVDLIPDNSIVREFIGGSILKEFKLWRNTSDFFDWNML